MAESAESEVERLQREVAFYRDLLDLSRSRDIEPLLLDALGLVVRATGSAQGYMEVREPGDGGEPAWSATHGLPGEGLEDIRDAVSRGIISAAISQGRTIVTPSALLDPRFRDRVRLRGGEIEAVLCSPLAATTPIGVVYLHRSRGGPYSARDRSLVERAARHVSALAERLLLVLRQEHARDATRDARAGLHLDGIVGRSQALAEVLRQVGMVAGLDVSVLLTGATGTGKNEIARAIHNNSARADRPFVEINCAGLPETLLENELFGSERGAHSTADRDAIGKVAAAEGGTLVLDEVSELAPAAQAKLLQLLQSGEYYPLGASNPRLANVRVIAASNADLRGRVADGRFREDLFYRLNVVPLHVPALAARRSDIPDLARHFCALTCERHALRAVEMAPAALFACQAAEWPGNVRELEHAVQAAAIRAAASSAPAVDVHHVFPDEPDPEAGPAEGASWQEATRSFHHDLLRGALERNDWNVAKTARDLSLARSRIYELIQALAINR